MVYKQAEVIVFATVKKFNLTRTQRILKWTKRRKPKELSILTLHVEFRGKMQKKILAMCYSGQASKSIAPVQRLSSRSLDRC